MKANQHRKLAAILFADIVGYTSLMQKDEAHTFQIIKRYQTILDSAAQQFNGQVLKNYGDGSLMTFSNSVDAVKAAKQIQEQAKLETPLPDRQTSVPLRIGIHVGEFIVEKGDIYGNGVNLASRIESLGIAGTVLFSKNIFQKIKNHPEFKVESLGSFEFKNVEEPMEVFALANEGFPIPKREEMQGKLKVKTKNNRKWLIPALLGLVLAVVGSLYFFNQNKISAPANIDAITIFPFEIKSGSPDIQYLGNGMVDLISTKLEGIPNLNPIDPNRVFNQLKKENEEVPALEKAIEISNTLANLKELKVAGRTSSFSFKEKEATIKEIGKALNVNHVLEGSVRKQGDKIRITAQLIKVADGFHMWSKKYDRNFDDIFAIQDELAQSIGEVLLEKLAPEQRAKLKTDLPRNSKAYDLFLSAKHIHFNVYRSGGNQQKDFDRSEQLFLQAIQLDSTYALAHAGLADLYDSYVGYTLKSKGDTIGEKKYMALSKDASDLAYRLNPELSYVNTVRGYVQVTQKNYREASKSFLKGYQLSPNNPDAIFGLQYFYGHLGLIYESIKIGNKLKEIDPLYETGLTENLRNNQMIGNGEQVIRDGQYILDLNRNSTIAMRSMFFNYFEANKKEEALAILERIHEIDSTYASQYLIPLWYELVKDNKEYIEKTLKEGDPYSKFIIHNFYGEDDKAEMELRPLIENASKETEPKGTIRDSGYLYALKNKLFEKYQDKDWFQKGLASEKEVYDYVANQFPSAEEVLEELKD